MKVDFLFLLVEVRALLFPVAQVDGWYVFIVVTTDQRVAVKREREIDLSNLIGAHNNTLLKKKKKCKRRHSMAEKDKLNFNIINEANICPDVRITTGKR